MIDKYKTITKTVERECPNAEFANKYASMLEGTYKNVEAFGRNGVWYVRFDKYVSARR